MNEAKPEEKLTKIEKVPFVELIVTDGEGRVLSTFGGTNAPLAAVLSIAAKVDDPNNPVKKDIETLTVLGQDFFKVSREFVLMVRGNYLLTKTLSEIIELEKAMPGTALYTFVVSY